MSSGYELEVIHIEANNIDASAEEIIGVLEDTSRNVVYFHGWDGLGASAAHTLVAQRLKSSTGLNKFDKVVYVDCSVWKSRRALQKVIVKELELPRLVRAIFDRCNEDDDFNGVDEGSRKEVVEVSRHIFRSLAYSTFVVIFENESNRYVDLSEFGIPLYPHLSNKMLWTFGVRFQKHVLTADDAKEVQKLLGNTSVFLHCDFTVEGDELGSAMWGTVHEEAKDVAERTGMPEYINHKIVEESFMYMLPPQKMKGIDWETHAFSYWVCDGILQGDTSAWEISDAMESYMHLDWNFHKEWTGNPSFSTTRHLHRDVPRQLPICCSSSSEITNVPPEATSFFAADTILRVGMFQHPGSSMSLPVKTRMISQMTAVKIIEFPNLRRIHMYELPKLQHICGSRMSAPNLETVVVRGCWSLRHLPAVSGNTTKQPKVNCEKDWWDKLECHGVEANHDSSLYELTHSKYYKAQLSRGALLR